MRVVLVCTGNTCRSPMAEGLLKRALKARRVEDVEVLSAGVAAMPGAPAARNAQAAMRELGADISGHRARALEDLDLTGALVLTMTRAQADHVRRTRPKARVFVLREYAGLGGEIPDPFGGPLDTYVKAALSIGEAVEATARKLASEE
jgi:protein-tyrosine-phosphatase